ncbi:hypothetical protein ACJMK2_034517 [Sinanodonta woodiana]|uniref:Uncharacterized protein n=1 Tax=Sinanodonta woodiana TaxID=1069815 RepID=A0ABD3WVY8_SINWO
MIWMPYAVVFFWGAFGKSDDIPRWAQTFPAIFAKSSIVWDPLVYMFTNRYFRKAFYKILPCENLKNKLLYNEEETTIPCTDEKGHFLEQMTTSISVIHPKRINQIEQDLDSDVRKLEPIDEVPNDDNIAKE